MNKMKRPCIDDSPLFS